MRYSLAAGAAALIVASTLTAASPATAAPSCRDVRAPVTVLGHREVVHGTLCTPDGGSPTVQLLIPGSTYNSAYWDYPDGQHSFRNAQNRAGFATLAVDRLGTGDSSKPLGLTLTSTAQAEAMHQVVQGLRSGAYGLSFRKVIIGGHSLGASISVLEAATYRDVDGVLLTGMTHRANPAGVAAAFANFIPANLDRKFGLLYPPGYLTTAPGKRYASFHAPGFLSPSLQALEESTKDVFSPTEAADSLGIAVILPYSRLINVPVLSVVGSEDRAVCGLLATNCSSAESLREDEAPYFSVPLDTYVLPDYGHSINLAPNAGQYYSAVASWALEEVGR
ncbi:pimeloyl-ACP methyl ester carboxylesterase [Saccharothrix tamanrassetensis]|uniref:Pimeloyl-ACP methyl ester carboxylesterase n=1 Tax=Saccharothrix tamanrassetensis TaxID=1051531 RepID=A0A841C625_9PSEU|nr:alpha/beta hydrolase [Saccharothrix tamanrassetensis]MBB5953992.1 pimeloyl-ACP methyl ester carboxylesterase [Saccharothrix tamanrassetensis]